MSPEEIQAQAQMRAQASAIKEATNNTIDFES